MDSDVLSCEFDQSAELVISVPASPDPARRDTSRSPSYSLVQFAHALGEALAGHGIGIRLDETLDGTRIISAWRHGHPNSQHVIPIDLVPVCPEQVDVIATLIKRNMDFAVTD